MCWLLYFCVLVSVLAWCWLFLLLCTLSLLFVLYLCCGVGHANPFVLCSVSASVVLMMLRSGRSFTSLRARYFCNHRVLRKEGASFFYNVSHFAMWCGLSFCVFSTIGDKLVCISVVCLRGTQADGALVRATPVVCICSSHSNPSSLVAVCLILGTYRSPIHSVPRSDARVFVYSARARLWSLRYAGRGRVISGIGGGFGYLMC